MSISPDMPDETQPRPMKSASAFRTISEVAEDLDVPQHVLRFWETKFPQIRPLKRAGGRRYYRPADIELLRKVSRLLYKEGYTIKGVQRLLKERGPKEALAEVPPALPFDFIEPEDAEEGETEQALADEIIGFEEPPALNIARTPAKRLDRASRSVLEGLLEELQALRALLKP